MYDLVTKNICSGKSEIIQSCVFLTYIDELIIVIV